MKRDIELLARAVCVADGRLLLCRGRNKAVTYLPGGHVEFGESAEEALAREIREEMGLGCAVKRFLGAVEHGFVQKGEQRHEVNLVFEVEIEGCRPDAPPASCEPRISFVWAAMDEVDGAGLEPAPLRCCLKEWLLRPARASTWESTF